jgi:hypothetical protein
VTRIYQTPKNR